MGVLDDTIAIFECFSLEEPAIGQADLARRLDRPKATVHRALKTLVASGLLEYDQSTRLYSPGMRLFELGQIFRSRHHFLDMVYKRVKQICDLAGHTGYITVFDGADLMVLRVVRGSNPLAIASTPGYKSSAYATSNGRAMLALLDDTALKNRVPEPLPYVSPNSPKDHAELMERIGKIRATGRSYASNEIVEGVSSQGIAMRDPDTMEIFGVAISYPASLGNPELKEKIAVLLDQMRTDLSNRLD
ncbi:IclR family transcriptional regulator [Agrobacterium tumefaciens]|uniref:IclR family transcriptional regulator n=1 Tax=Agrobacterium tumefaciens TaxID=358 RepID=UPI00287E1109|nr:IclR family transcriptional regulator [Agrobacterium tumefaciens]MDS7594617.1 IclR family transcriptional regulator [Agrobacterium tumefaciens]